ncbi:ribonuclease H-like domain-containing protein [Alicyclobacillus pomorum]|uniref:ribonuclease H-like domain-containing protein n=1 Tax=Alicyclobacillus pomorum TaxID=204470 RepID=UPI0004032C40|nr:ribonuclease H-like domain-containing protein [Alicyclobacillus pomorum]
MARSLKERLAALQKSVGRPDVEGTPTPPQPPVREDAFAAEVPPAEEHPLVPLGFQPCGGAGAGCWVRVLRYDLLTVHGNVRFGDILSAKLDVLCRAVRQPCAEAENLRFYDTETTGLGTGAGTIPFLHAVARIEGDELVLYQYFLEDYGGEAALLEELSSKHFTEGVQIVSFNGKSFDWPLLKNRMTMYRMRQPELGQIDLLYPSRRLWKARLERVTLGAVEEAVLGLVRTDDLPGKEAPGRYFEYAVRRDAELLAPVFEHNATDVCSLVGLTVTLAAILAGDLPVERSSEHVAIGRYYDEWQEYDLAAKCFVAALQCPDADWKSHWLYSLHLKRRQLWAEATRVWEHMAHAYSWSVQPAVELAKYYEHRQRDYALAEHWTAVALERAVVQSRIVYRGGVSVSPDLGSEASVHPVVASLRHRLQRVQRKAHRQGATLAR